MTSHESGIPQLNETFGSWIARWVGRRQIPQGDFLARLEAIQEGAASAFLMEPDFIRISRWGPAIRGATGIDLAQLAIFDVPAPRCRLLPDARQSACLECLSEDGPPERQTMRREWTLPWKLYCARHALPLVWIPVVGWQWANLDSGSRDIHRRLMYRPGSYSSQFRESWQRVPQSAKSILRFTERSIDRAFCETPEGPIAGTMLRVWRDLLVLLSHNWWPVDNTFLAAEVCDMQCLMQTSIFRAHRADFSYKRNLRVFLRTSDPAVRRVVLLAAGTVVRCFRFNAWRNRADLHADERARLLTFLPDHAQEWLEARVAAWPAAARLCFAAGIS